MRSIGRALSRSGTGSKQDGYVGPIASVDKDGKSMNVNNLSASQLRNLMNMSPYGISSCPTVGMKAQVIVNDYNNNTVVGVYDKDKPKANPGETILYSIGGAFIVLDKYGNIIVRTNEAIIGIQPNGSISINGNVDINGSLKINGVPIEQLFG